ncbi:hypothetical protein L345_07770, partial [Ophiophagus hannah]
LARRYQALPNGKLSSVADASEAWHFRSLHHIFMSIFLPQGYPESVSMDYLAYQFWDTIQAFASSITGTLATQAVLKGVGVGDETSTVAAATVTWILKGGPRLNFSRSKLDCDAKQWRVTFSIPPFRLFADVLNDVAIFMEICIVGVAGGATRAALTMHQARRDNMADVSAKDGSQETLVNLAGLLFSLFLIPIVVDNLLLTYALYALFTILHLYANYQAVRAVCMETVNRARLHLVLQHYLKWGEVPGPAVINPQEPLLLGLISILLHRQAVSEDVIKAYTHGLLLEVLLYQDMETCALERRSLLNLQHQLCKGDDLGSECGGRNKLVLPHLSLLCAWHKSAVQALPHVLSSFFCFSESSKEDPRIHSEMHQFLDRIFPKFLAGLTAAGWVTDRNLLGPEEWRMEWLSAEKKML